MPIQIAEGAVPGVLGPPSPYCRIRYTAHLAGPDHPRTCPCGLQQRAGDRLGAPPGPSRSSHHYGLKSYYARVLRKPWEHLDLIKPPTAQRLPDILTVAETVRLIQAIHTLSYRVFFFTLYSLGLRLRVTAPDGGRTRRGPPTGTYPRCQGQQKSLGALAAGDAGNAGPLLARASHSRAPLAQSPCLSAWHGHGQEVNTMRASAGWSASSPEPFQPPNFLVTFTPPAQLRPLALAHQRVVYDLMIRASREALRIFARND